VTVQVVLRKLQRLLWCALLFLLRLLRATLKMHRLLPLTRPAFKSQ
jgi:hypothetical protein